MGRLCIVSRDSPRLLGYLMVVLDKELRGPDAIELVVDRRHPDPAGSAPGAPDRAERRRGSEAIEDALRTRGYALVGDEAVSERIRISAARARRRRVLPGLRRVARLAPIIALTFAVAAAALGFLSTTAAGRARILSRIISWVPTLPTRTSVAEPTTAAPRPAPAPSTSTLAPREPSVTPPAPALPQRGPQVASTPAAISRPEPAPALPPAARREASPTLPGTTVSRRDLAPALPPTTASRREAPTPQPSTAVTRRETSATARATSGPGRETLASAAPTPRRTAKAAGPPRVELDARPEGVEAERVIVYTVRLSDSSGRPLDDAAVSLHGWLPNGSDLTTSLQSTETPGTYSGSVQVGQRTPTNLRVRVTHEGLRFELPSGR